MTTPSAKLSHFHGGLHLAGHKEESTRTPVVAAALPARLYLPLQQHIGEPAEPIVSVGEQVLKGQQIAHAHGYISVPIHASSSGTVVEIAAHPVPHPSGMRAPCIVIETDGEDRWTRLQPLNIDFRDLNPSALRNRLRETGIVGLGGAGFPSFIKLNPGARTFIDTLILNGAECEPWITCDDMLMREHAREVIQGARIMRHALQAKQCIIGIEDNKPEAYAALSAAAQEYNGEIDITAVPTLYPTGGEKQLIKVLTGKEVPCNGLPLDIGIVCHNVGTAAAVCQAILHGKPLISRIVTVTGKGVREPKNMEVLLGTPMRELIDQCGGFTDNISHLIVGGPMMGYALHDDQAPVVKTTNCLLATEKEDSPEKAQLPCIRCSACAQVCPAQLLPQQLYWYAHARDFDKTQDFHLFDCIECGCCAYVCPSHIPLVQYYRFAKTEIWAQEREKRSADIARQRHEFRIERLEREKREKEERLRRKKEALNKPREGGSTEDPKQAAIQAALARVRSKQEKSATTPRNTENLTDEQRKKIEEVDRRRKQMPDPASAAVDNLEE